MGRVITHEFLNKIDAYLKRSHRYGSLNRITETHEPLFD